MGQGERKGVQWGTHWGTSKALAALPGSLIRARASSEFTRPGAEGATFCNTFFFFLSHIIVEINHLKLRSPPNAVQDFFAFLALRSSMLSPLSLSFPSAAPPLGRGDAVFAPLTALPDGVFCCLAVLSVWNR